MHKTARHLGMYLHLARASQQRRQPLVRDRLFVLAGALAARLDLNAVAAYCRREILSHNPQHLVRRWPTFGAALGDEDFQSHHKQLKRRYPSEKVEQMLMSLGIQMAREREAYFSDYEYAAAILGTTTKRLDEQFGESE